MRLSPSVSALLVIMLVLATVQLLDLARSYLPTPVFSVVILCIVAAFSRMVRV